MQTLACSPSQSYQTPMQPQYYQGNDFGFGNMQPMDEEDYSNEPPLLEGNI